MDNGKCPIKEYENLYSVDTSGNVYSNITSSGRRKGRLKPELKNGYLSVNLYKDGKCKHHYVHRLVASTFIPNPNNYTEINHIDCDKLNNSVLNLEWCSRKMNLLHSYNKGLKRKGELHGAHKLSNTDVIKIRHSRGLFSLKELAEKYGVAMSTISAIQNKRTWKEGDNYEII